MYKVGSTTLMLCCACNCMEHSGLKSRKKCNLLKAITLLLLFASIKIRVFQSFFKWNSPAERSEKKIFFSKILAFEVIERNS